jgi:IS30 family transposase
MQGKRFTDEQVHRIKYLLAKTEMTIHEIAVRTGSSESTVATINRRFDVRRYNGKRAQWEMGSAFVVESSVRAVSAPSTTDFRGEIQYHAQRRRSHSEHPELSQKSG